MIVEVLVEIKIKKEDKTFTYKVPENLEKDIKIGKRVLVPFGKQKLEGFVLNVKRLEKLEYEIKDIIEVIDEEAVLNKELLELGKYISKKTLSPLITSYQTMLPSALKAKNKIKINKKYETYIRLNKEFKPSTENQKQILSLLNKDKIILKSKLNKISSYTVKKLIENNILIEEIKEVYRINKDNKKVNSNIILNKEQENVVKEVIENKNKFIPYLLHGVTGSGKTEVYMHIIENIIKDNKEAMILVPEISLTPQLIDQFEKRFGNLIAVLHSKLSNGEKYDEWRKILNKEAKIVIGARSAVFAPLTNIGIIIIDEEHSETYKQENNPKYNAIDIALYRAKTYNCPILLGSATPSIESYTRAKTGIYKLLELKNRINNNMPEVTLIDMKDEIRKGNRILSELLKNKINDCLDRDEQVILLLNRRGYSTVITCSDCGYIDKCPNCDIPLTLHKSSNTMRCHYCGYGSRIISTCPICKSNKLSHYGMGTQKLEQIIKETFIKAKVVRMDIDTTSRKGSMEKIVNDFKKGIYNILIGTQMISKGLDFEKVTLVGVLNGDNTLNIPDFRSGERTYQLLNQTAGRSGRSKLKGSVIIQGFNIDHYSIKYASNNDYISFYNEEMIIRKKLKYPPFYNLCLIKIKDKDLNKALEEGERIVKYLKQKLDIIILGPSTSTMPKINNIYNIQVLLKYKNTKEIIKELIFINQNSKLNIDIDLNPLKI